MSEFNMEAKSYLRLYFSIHVWIQILYKIKSSSQMLLTH